MTTTTNVFPTLTAHTTDAEMLALLKNPEIAIGFALEHLEPFELGMFFKDWKDDADMTGWLREWRIGQDAALRSAPHYQVESGIPLPPEDSQPDYSDMRAFNRGLAAQRRGRQSKQ